MNEKRGYRGYIVSSVFHIFLALVFLKIGIDLSPQLPEFFELTFTTVTAGETEGKVYTPPPPRTSKPTGVQTTSIKMKEVVELPQRRTVDIEVPEIPVAEKEKIFANESPMRLGDKIEIGGEPERETPENILSLLGEGAEDFDIEKMSITEKFQADTISRETGMNVSSVKSYMIEWVGGQREKLRGNLPVYPQGINKTAVIRLRFEVFPNGTVGEILPLRKGNTILENIAINSLKEWQFNSFEEEAPRVIQEGIITFIYKLE